MRTLVIAAAIAVLAAFPCAWDANPHEAAPVVAIFSSGLSSLID